VDVLPNFQADEEIQNIAPADAGKTIAIMNQDASRLAVSRQGKIEAMEIQQRSKDKPDRPGQNFYEKRTRFVAARMFRFSRSDQPIGTCGED
jgi:hypothetical protein